MSQVLALTDGNFEKEVFRSQTPVLVDFWASWCPPCKMVEPVIEELAKEHKGKIKIAKMNVDQNPRTASKFRIGGVPTFILFNSGKRVQQRVGAQSKRQLQQMIKTAKK